MEPITDKFFDKYDLLVRKRAFEKALEVVQNARKWWPGKPNEALDACEDEFHRLAGLEEGD